VQVATQTAALLLARRDELPARTLELGGQADGVHAAPACLARPESSCRSAADNCSSTLRGETASHPTSTPR
jgi:hypothetical protein